MQAYDTANLIDSAVSATGGSMEDQDAVRAALRAADFTSVRGDFAFNGNHYPVQDFNALTVVKREDGAYHTSFVQTIVEGYEDSFNADCDM